MFQKPANSNPGTSAPLFTALLIFVFLSLATILIGARYYVSVNNSMTQRIFSGRWFIANLSASAAKTKLDQLVNLATNYASNPGLKDAVKNSDWDKANSIIKNLEEDPYFYDFYIERILIESTDGRIKIAFPGFSKEGINKLDQTFEEWRGPILEENRKSFATNVYKRDIFPKRNLVKIVVPIESSSKIIGVVALTIPINEFSDLCKDIDLSSTGFAYLIDRVGQIIAHPKFSSDGPIIDYSVVPSVKKLLRGESGVNILHNPIENQTRVTAYQKIPVYGWGVVAQEPVGEAFQERDFILNRILLLMLFVCVIDAILSIAVFWTMRKCKKSQP